MKQGYKLFEIDKMTMYDIEHINKIYEEREVPIDKAFPLLFPKNK